MSTKTRKLLFYISALVFLIAAGPVLVYSFGYRFNWGSTFSLEPTGGLFIAARPNGTKIYVNDMLERETSFINSSVFIPSLTPELYTIRVEKPGYATWTKTLSVKPQIVTEVYATLIPLNAEPTILASNLSDNFLVSSPSGLQVVREVSATGTSTLRFYDIENNEFVAPSSTITHGFTDNLKELPKNFSWTSNSSSGVATYPNDWVLFAFASDSTVSASSLYEKSGLKEAFKTRPREIIARPNTSSQYYVIFDTDLQIWDTATKKLSPMLQDIAGLLVTDDRLYIMNAQSGLLYEAGLDGKNARQLTVVRMPGIKDARISKFQDYYILKSSSGMYFIDSTTGVPELLSEKAIEAKFNQNGRNLIWWDEHSVWIKWIASKEKWPHYQNIDEERLYTSESVIRDVYFYPRQDYIIVSTGTKVNILEFDGREEQRNIATLYSGKNPRIYVPARDKFVYVLDSGKLMQFKIE